MHNVLVDDLKSNIEKLDELHAGDYYGGSDVASICGIGWESPLEVWLRKTGKVSTHKEATDQMLLGSFLEPELRRLLERRTGKAVMPINQIWQHAERPWMIGAPDCSVGEDDLGELKTHKIYAEKYWSETSASDSALCQLQWYLEISGKAGGYCAALIAGDCEKFFHPYFERSADVAKQLIERVEKFRELVKSDTPPGAGPMDAELIREHLVKSVEKDKQLDITETHTQLLGEYFELLKKQQDRAEENKAIEDGLKRIKNQFVADSQGCGQLLVGNARVKISKVCVQPYMNKGSEYFRVTIREE